MPTRVDLTTDLLRLEIDDDGVATVWLDDPEASVNKLSRASLEGFSEVLDQLEDRQSSLVGAVFASAKEDSFVVGADLGMISQFDTPAEVQNLTRRAHRLLWRLDHLVVPTVAAIEGPCMGGGLELILGCDYRLASTHDDTKLALPEIKLGLLPGGGGTQYLPRLVGIQQALTLMLTGKNTYPEKARSIGLVDALIHPPGLHQAAKRAVRQLARGDLALDRNRQPLSERLLESNTVSRRVLYRQARKRAEKRTNGNYPAPPRLVDAVRTGIESGLDAGLDAEMRHFSELVFTPESNALVQLFFARQEAETPPTTVEPAPVRTVGLLGAGLMGRGIAEVTATNDVNVIQKDQNLDLAARGKQQIWAVMNANREKGIVNRFERDQITERVIPTDRYDPMAHCDLVIEAVPEDLDLKRQVLSEVEAVTAPDTVLASNTSALPIAAVAEGVDAPERVIGMHYFSPVPDVPLVEIVVAEQTADDTVATAFALARRQGKVVIVVNDGPGFYTTRILALYLNEALLLLEEGADIEKVDETMRNRGFPMGPYELLDFVGIDVAAKITEVMDERLPLDRLDISDSAVRLADAGLKGQKTNVGFYHYSPSETDDPDREEVNEEVDRYLGSSRGATVPGEEIWDRLTLMMVNEAVRCLQEGIIETPTDGDLGAVFGLGFPPFLGGPFRYVDQQGAGQITRRLQDLKHQYGDRFEPAERLREHSSESTSFHR